jgi:hypothetical protein
MTDDFRSLLLQALAARSGTSTGLGTQELLSQLGNTDPTMSLVAELLARQQQTEELDNETPADGGPSSELLEPDDQPHNHALRSNERGRAFHELRQGIEAMHAELQERRERDAVLAAALGACEFCWGENPSCPVCGGEGVPGSSVPPTELFMRYIAPAARKLPRQDSTDRGFANADPPNSSRHEPQRKEDTQDGT